MAFVVVQLPDSGWSGLVLRATLGSATYAIAAVALNLLDSQEHATRFAKRAARWWTAFRSNGALRKFRSGDGGSHHFGLGANVVLR